MEVKSRTEEQIRARVEKLGLTSAGSVSSDEEMSDTAGKDDRGAGDDGAGNDKPLSSDDDEEQGVTNSVGSGSPPSPAPARRIKRISQPQSDDDSEGLFSSTEVRAIVCFIFSLIASRRRRVEGDKQKYALLHRGLWVFRDQRECYRNRLTTMLAIAHIPHLITDSS